MKIEKQMTSPKHSIAFLFVVLFAFALNAHAQACGAYYITVSVQDEAGKPVNNAKVDLRPIEKDESEGKNFVRDVKDPSVYSLQLSEGQPFEHFHEIMASAPGFKAADLQAKFRSCVRRGIVVKLSKTGPAVWQFKNTVEVEVSANGSKDIDGLKLIVIDSQGRSQDVPVQGWFAFVDLPNGEYTFRFNAPGYQTLDKKVDLRPLADMILNLELKKKN